jgi:hypothetical protein
VLQEATEEATPAAFLFVVAAAGQAARETTNSILYLVERAAATLLLDGLRSFAHFVPFSIARF